MSIYIILRCDWYEIMHSIFLSGTISRMPHFTFCFQGFPYCFVLCQGCILRVCGAHPVKLNMTWHFPDRAIKVKSQKSYEDNSVLSSPNVRAIQMFSMLSYSKRNLLKLLLQLSAALFQCWVNFTPLLSLSDKTGCATFHAHGTLFGGLNPPNSLWR